MKTENTTTIIMDMMRQDLKRIKSVVSRCTLHTQNTSAHQGDFTPKTHQMARLVEKVYFLLLLSHLLSFSRKTSRNNL